MAVLVAMVAALSMAGVAFPQGALEPSRQVGLLPTAAIVVGGVPLTVEIASDPAALALGLGERDGLAPGTGMLFVFDAPAVRSFWMKGMRFCLDIVWIEGGVIQGAAQGACPDPAGTPDAELTPYTSPVPVSYVLEVPAGWLAANGFGVGTKVVGLP
jgi:uncharacterized membrane protein (UPF0127 family)